MTITYLYKCRRCGEIERDKQSIHDLNPSEARPTFPEAGNHASRSLGHPPMFQFHDCRVGAVGLTDLVGYELDQ